MKEELRQATTRFTPQEYRILERAAKRQHYPSVAKFLHDAGLHLALHRASIKRPTLGRWLRTAEAASTVDGFPEAQEAEELAAARVIPFRELGNSEEEE